MCNYKVGDEVVLSCESYQIGSEGDTAKITKDYGDGLYRIEITSGKSNGKTCVKFSREFKKTELNYCSSNRYKLKQAIIKTGFTSDSLSIELGKAKTYLTGITSNSRFISRGDISDESLNKLITDLAFAERNLLAVKAKIIDDKPKVMMSKGYHDAIQKSLNEKAETEPHNNDDKIYLSDKEFVVNKTTDFINYCNESPKNYKYILFCIAWVITVFIGFIGFLCWLAFK